MSEVIQKVVEDYFVKQSLSFYVINDTKKLKYLDKTLQLISEFAKFDLKQLDADLNLNKSAIVLLSSPESLLKFEEKAQNFKNLDGIFIVCNGSTTLKAYSNL